MPIPIILPVLSAAAKAALAGAAAYGLTQSAKYSRVMPKATPVGPKRQEMINLYGTGQTTPVYNTPGVEVSDATRVARPVYVAPAKRKVRTLVTSVDATRALDKQRDAEKARRDSTEVARRNAEVDQLKQERDSLRSVLEQKNKEPENKKPDENKPEQEKPKNENKGDTPNEKKKNFIQRGVNKIGNSIKTTYSPTNITKGAFKGIGYYTRTTAPVEGIYQGIHMYKYGQPGWKGPITYPMSYIFEHVGNDTIPDTNQKDSTQTNQTNQRDTVSTSNNTDNSAKVFEVMKQLNQSNGTDTLTNRY